ncbi:MAG: RagB/SusD family nutrient uptake outer membrane protein [Gemmatimonadota bacterium]
MKKNSTIRIALLSSSLALTACGDIFSLKQSNPGQLTADAVYQPANAQLLVNGAIADFECSFARYVVNNGLFMDELHDVIASSSNYDIDRRILFLTSPYAGGCGGVQTPGYYTAFSTARGTADEAYKRLEGWTDAEVANRTRLMAQMAAYSGYSIVFLAEGMCSAAIDLSPELTPAQLFTEAILRFDKAVTAATAANDQITLNFARLGRARAQRGAGNLAAAGTDAALIPANFLVATSADAVNPRRQNMVFVHTVLNFYSSVDSSFRNLTLNGAPDPRVQVVNSGRTGTQTAAGQVWQASKYPLVTTPMPIARYAEAQLILAEARTAAGDLNGAATAINNARNSGRTGMPQFSAAGMTTAQVLDQIIEERRRELFLEGHRLGDIRKYNLALRPAAGTPYTIGGGTYGDLRCFPLPAVERNNNPNIAKG